MTASYRAVKSGGRGFPKEAIGWSALRWFYALWFTIGAFVMPLHALTGWPPLPPMNSQARVFIDNLEASGFLSLILTADYLIGGLALMSRRTVPLALVLLGPPTVVICGFHFWLSHLYATAALFGAGFIALVWRNRAVLRLLWSTDVEQDE